MKRLAVVAVAVWLAALAVSLTAQPPLDGQLIFRYETFNDEQLWTDTLRLHEAAATVTPKAALGVGLKVDVEALPADVIAALKANPAMLDDPAVTLALLSLNAVVGVVGRVRGGTLETIGITCALCHSTVDDSYFKGIGRPLDGWPNRDLNSGSTRSMDRPSSRCTRRPSPFCSRPRMDCGRCHSRRTPLTVRFPTGTVTSV